MEDSRIPDYVLDGVHKWAEMCWKKDWMHERTWYIRLLNWYSRNFKGVYPEWYGDDEIASSIVSYISLEKHK